MRVEAASVIAAHAGAAALHAMLLADGMRLRPLARAWFLRPRGLVRVSLVWRDRLAQTSTVMTITVPAARLTR